MFKIIQVALISTILLLTVSGCHSDEKAIKRFELQLGAVKSKALTDIVESFEQEIENKYGTDALDIAYKRHLEYVKNDSTSFTNWLEAQDRRDSIFGICECGLLEEIWIAPDTVFADDRMIWSVFLHPKSQDTVMRTGQSLTKEQVNGNLDSIMNVRKRLKKFRSGGDLMFAFQDVSSENDVLEWYYETKLAAGSFSRSITADVFLQNKTDFDNYFVKRIIVIETYY